MKKMPRVEKIKVEELKYDKIVPQLEKAYPFLKLSKDDLKTIVEKTPSHQTRISYELLDANTALANGWRRTMIDEIEYPRLTCAMTDVKSDDPFCQRMTDYIQNRIWLIPTSYLERGATIKMELDVKNLTTETRIVKSSEIRFVGAANKTLKWAQEVDVMELQPGRFLKIPITVEWGYNYTHASFSSFHSIVYRPLEFKEPYPPSYTVHPKNYLLGCQMDIFCDPKKMVRLGWETIRDRVERAREFVAEFQKISKLPYLSADMNVSQLKGQRVQYEFVNESYTLSNLLAWYVYQADPDIKLVHAGDDHPEDASTLLKINHTDHAKILIRACEMIERDLKAIIARF